MAKKDKAAPLADAPPADAPPADAPPADAAPADAPDVMRTTPQSGGTIPVSRRHFDDDEGDRGPARATPVEECLHCGREARSVSAIKNICPACGRPLLSESEKSPY